MEQKLLKQINRLLTTAIIGLILILAMGVVVLSGNEPQKSEMIQTLDPNQEELLKRGAYIVNTSGCNDCHSPKVMTLHGPEPDPNKLLSGYLNFVLIFPIFGLAILFVSHWGNGHVL